MPIGSPAFLELGRPAGRNGGGREESSAGVKTRAAKGSQLAKEEMPSNVTRRL